MDSLGVELYKNYVGDLASIGARYAAANGFYLSVVSALLGIFAFVESGEALGDISFFITIAIPAFGCVICWIWYKTIKFYSTLFLAKFDVLREAEAEFPFKYYRRETDILVNTHKVEWLNVNERRVPITLGALFAFMFFATPVLYFF